MKRISLILSLTLLASISFAKKGGDNALSKKEKNEGWMLLFDGKTTDGWRSYKKETFPNGWIIEDGALKCNASGRGEDGAHDAGDIVYNKEFENFHLKIDWKISEGGNSGIFYLGQEEMETIWRTAPELQVLDNERHKDANKGKNGNRKAGSLYDIIPADPQNTKPAGQWNTVEVICNNGKIIHMQNGKKVVEYELWTDEWNEMVAESKFPKLNPDWANVAKKGLIGLQDHGDDVWFKNIKIKEL